jgi:hypothetical protein
VLLSMPAPLTSWCSTSIFGNVLVTGEVGVARHYGLHSFASVPRTVFYLLTLFRFHSLARGPCKLMLRKILVPLSSVGLTCR